MGHNQALFHVPARRAVFGAAVSKYVLPLELVKGRGATGPAPGEAVDDGDNVHCEVEVSGLAAAVWWVGQRLALQAGGQAGCSAAESDRQMEQAVSIGVVNGMELPMSGRQAIVEPCSSSTSHSVYLWQGYISNADYSGKRTQMVLFINGRSGGWVRAGVDRRVDRRVDRWTGGWARQP